jgi:hypothetical protein
MPWTNEYGSVSTSWKMKVLIVVCGIPPYLYNEGIVHTLLDRHFDIKDYDFIAHEKYVVQAYTRHISMVLTTGIVTKEQNTQGQIRNQ